MSLFKIVDFISTVGIFIFLSSKVNGNLINL